MGNTNFIFSMINFEQKLDFYEIWNEGEDNIYFHEFEN